MINSVRSDEVRRLVMKSKTSDSLGADKRLGELADSYRFEGARVVCENGADRDEVISMLSSYGCSSVKEDLYGE